MLDCTEMTWEQMSEIIFAIREEAKRRNPIGINLYVPYLKRAEEALLEIAGGEEDNPTSDVGPTAAPETKKPATKKEVEKTRCKYCNSTIYQPTPDKPTHWLSTRSMKATCYPHCGDVHVPKL